MHRSKNKYAWTIEKWCIGSATSALVRAYVFLGPETHVTCDQHWSSKILSLHEKLVSFSECFSRFVRGHSSQPIAKHIKSSTNTRTALFLVSPSVVLNIITSDLSLGTKTTNTRTFVALRTSTRTSTVQVRIWLEDSLKQYEYRTVYTSISITSRLTCVHYPWSV